MCSEGYYSSGNACVLQTICDKTTQYYHVNTLGGHECFPYTACDVDFGEADFCSENGQVRKCVFRNNYVQRPLNGTTDRICVASKKCGTDEYMYREQLTDNTGVVLRMQECRSYTECKVGEYHRVAGRQSEDRDNICVEVYTCLDTEYEMVAPGNVTNRECQLRKTCDTGGEYMQLRGDAYSDNVCAPALQCRADEFVVSSAQDSNSSGFNGTDTVCRSHRVCTLGQGIVMHGSTYLDATCGDCRTGTFGDGVRCTTCAAGTFVSTPGSLNCTLCNSCPGSNFSSLCSSTNDSVCMGACPDSWLLHDGTGLCEKCAPGYFEEEALVECVQCPVNHYCPSKHKRHMQACPANPSRNSTSPAGSELATACQCNREGGSDGDALGLVGCQTCKVGFYAEPSPNRSTCQRCPLGTYSDQPEALQCTPCPSDRSNTHRTGSSSEVECTRCLDGQYEITGGCRDCRSVCQVGEFELLVPPPNPLPPKP
jgi:hypothetical protein